MKFWKAERIIIRGELIFDILHSRTQDIKVYPYYLNSATTYLSSITLGSNDSGWTTPRTFTATQSGTVLIMVYPFNQSSFSTTATGYNIRVY